MKTANELNKLKVDWLKDPCWDIEETEGFEDHWHELLEYRKAREAQWVREDLERVWKKSESLKCSSELVRYLDRIEARIQSIEDYNRLQHEKD